MRNSFVYGIFVWLCLSLNNISYGLEIKFNDGKSWQETDQWKEIISLKKDLKYKAALKIINKKLKEFIQNADNKNWTRALILKQEIMMSLGQFDLSIKEYKGAKWPAGFSSQTVLTLYYVQALHQYFSRYSWEINQREKKLGLVKNITNLKEWTREEIFLEMQSHLLKIWKKRDEFKLARKEEIGDFLSLGNYPAYVRATLRNTLSHLYIQFLADTQFWSPKESNEVKQLALNLLMKPQLKWGQETFLKNSDHHPLQKVLGIISDLEKWHWNNDQIASLLDTKIERFKQLKVHFTQEDDLKKLLTQLEGETKDYQIDPWWAEVAYIRAKATMELPHERSHIEAINIAQKGVKLFPKKLGGKHCEDLINQIKRPSLDIQVLAKDQNQKDSIQISHKNWDKVYFKAYEFDPLKYLLANNKNRNLPDRLALKNYVKGKAISEWEQKLDNQKDYKIHKTFSQIPLKKKGFYIILSSADDKFNLGTHSTSAHFFNLTDLAVMTQKTSKGILFQLHDAGLGKMIPHAKLKLYKNDWKAGHKFLKDHSFNKKGTLLLATKDLSNRYSYFYTIQTKNDELYKLDNFYAYPLGQATPNLRHIILTDRDIYRPGQKVYFKVLSFKDRSPLGELPRMATKKSFTLSLKDSNWKKVKSFKLTSNSFGTSSGSFVLPTGKNLGQWSLSVNQGSGNKYIKVEEYKRPTFFGEFLDNQKQLRFNKTATIQGKASYYYGSPVSNGKIKWSVTRRASYPYWYFWCRPPIPSGQSQVIAAGSTRSNNKGQFTIDFLPKVSLSEVKDGVSYDYAVSATVTNPGGESNTIEKVYSIGNVALKAAIKLNKQFLTPVTKVEFDISLTNLNQSPQAGVGNWELFLLDMPKKTDPPHRFKQILPSTVKLDYQTKGDRQIFRTNSNWNNDQILSSWKKKKKIKAGDLIFDQKGVQKLSVGKLKAGAYRLTFYSKDEFSSPLKKELNFMVLASKNKMTLPLILKASHEVAKINDKVIFYVQTGYTGNDVYFEIIQRDKVLLKKHFEKVRQGQTVSFKIKREHLGGLTARAYTFKDHVLVKKSINLNIPYYDQNLDIDVSKIKSFAYPGSKQKWKVSLKAKNSKNTSYPLKKQTEVLAYMYDKSLELFSRHTPGQLSRFFPVNKSKIPLNYHLAVARQVDYVSFDLPKNKGFTLSPDTLPLVSNYGIGGLGTRGGFGNSPRLMRKSKTAPMAEMAMAQSDTSEGLSNSLPKKVQDKSPSATKKSSPKPILSQLKVRRNFNETAFFKPHLKTNKKGEISLDFTLPDSLTTWKLWLHALGKKAQYGQASLDIIASKDLMVKAYLPRFFRQNDQVDLKVMVTNNTKKSLGGKFYFDIFSQNKKSAHSLFKLPKKYQNGLDIKLKPKEAKDFVISFSTDVPIETYLFKFYVKNKNFSDGEEHYLNVLPSRVHLSESKFITLSDQQKRKINFQNMKEVDKTRKDQSMVIKVDSQLFYSTLEALPYIMNYPYKSAIQLMSDFVTTSILGQTYQKYPSVQAMAKKLSGRKTLLETIPDNDPNGKMKLEETPWLVENNSPDIKDLINTLRPDIVRDHAKRTLTQLKDYQTGSGGFSWFQGGRPSRYVTLYVLHGFAKIQEFGGKLPAKVLAKAWQFIKSEYQGVVDDCMKDAGCFELITYVNYILSSFKDKNAFLSAFPKKERLRMLDFSYEHWTKHAPVLKTMLALTLFRYDRKDDAQKVMNSILDSAQSDPDKGTFWTPEARSWLWYNDTLESQTYILRALLEIQPQNRLNVGLVKWIFLNKKLNRWKSTKATAEVIYALTHYLDRNGTLTQENTIDVKVGEFKQQLTFKSDEYTGKDNFIVLKEDAFKPQSMSEISFSQAKKGISFASVNWHYSTEQLPKKAVGDFLSIDRKYFLRKLVNNNYTLKQLKPGAMVKIGDEVEIQLTLNTKHKAEFIHLKNPRPTGFEPLKQISRYKWDLGLSRYEQVRDTGMNFFMEFLPQGEYVLKHRIKATMAGVFKIGPATMQSLYAPEFNAYSAGFEIKVEQQ